MIRDPAGRVGAESGGSLPRLVVGVGASAGGLDACNRFLSAMPADCGMAVVIVLHLDPSRESHFAELFRRSTAMDVVQVTTKQTLVANRVYVIAPDSSLEIRDGDLNPHKPNDPRGHRKPIDALFSSLGEDRRERAAAVVLSGTGDNGSAGIRHVKARGGLCLAQDPKTADHTGMPRSAIATGVIDYVLSPEAMPRVLVEHASRLEADPKGRGSRDETGPLDAFDGILDLLGRSYGLNFRSSYKPGTLERRMARRMSLEKVDDRSAYLEMLQNDPQKLAALYSDSLIGVTRFFRNADLWHHLETEVVPRLFERLNVGERLKLWVPGCATGEEAYSLAILLLEHIEKARLSAKVQIFASDVAEEALRFARRGEYPSSIEDSVSPERLSRYFRSEGSGFQVRRDVRDIVTFAAHNVLADPPFSKLDLVSCRNLMIYLEQHAQKQVLEIFHFALKRGGLLVLGSSETAGQNGHLFDVVSPKLSIYESVAISDPERQAHGPWTPVLSQLRGLAPASVPLRGPRMSRALEHLVLSRYTSACVAINESLEIESFFGPTEDYLTRPTGDARMDLLAWVKPGIYSKLRAALKRAREGSERVTLNDMRIDRGGDIVGIECTIEPVTPLPGEPRVFLVSFRDVPGESHIELGRIDHTEESLVRQLEAELKSARGDLRGAVEQLDSSNEEYQVSHEELLSLNEELQSNNEELESSKEELQSLNEEMVTLNRQLEDKNAELLSQGSDLSNLLVSTAIPILFLSRKLQVRRFTPPATQLFRLLPSDVGRSVEHVKFRFEDERFFDDVRRVLETLLPVRAEIQSEEERLYTRTVLPYRTDDDRIDGVCITFHEITAERRAARDSEDARRFAEAIVETTPTPLLVLDADLRVAKANGAFYDTFRVGPNETVGSYLYDLGNHQWSIPSLRKLLEAVLPEEREVRDYRVEHDFEHIGTRFMSLNARQMQLRERPQILLAIDDVTEQTAARRKSEGRANELTRDRDLKDEFLAMLGHELRNPLAALMQGLALLDMTENDQARVDELHAMMSRQATRINGILTQLLDIARLTTGKMRMVLARMDLSDAIRGALDTVSHGVEASGHHLEVQLPSDGSAIVEGDVGQLTQVIENVLANAVKYTEAGGRIELSLRLDAGSAQIRVKDNGVGIEPSLLPHIFEPFTQAPRTLDRAMGGLGLGLPLVERVVRLHDGTVEASSPGIGQGSEFVITLPLARDASEKGDSETATTAEVGPDGPSAPPVLQPRRVLVVDDEVDIASSLVETLSAMGHHARSVLDGPSALEAVGDFDPEVVVLDLGLPGLDGYEVARRLRESRGDALLLISLTGYDAKTELLEEAGFDRHLVKPADMQVLSRWLASWEKS